MVFASITFLIYFLPLFLITYFVCGDKLRNTVLLIFSIVFYAWGEPLFILILLVWTFINHLVLSTSLRKSPGKKKLYVGFSVVFTLLLLLVYKYTGFLVSSLNSVITASGFQFPVPEIALPIGISFFTFQSISYSIDILRNEAEPVKSYRDYLLYISMFPQLLAGPIVRFKEVSEQIRDRRVTNEKIAAGYFRFCVGLAKKVLIADMLGAYVDNLLSSGATYDTPTSWVILLCYSFQIYFDFSGYSDMAIGLGLIMGFRFPENFNYPYISKSITEFWRRWHITLGNWMKDYLYIPLGGNKVSVKRTYINLWLVFLLSGLWHGASWNFVLWGAYHGIFLVIERALGSFIKFRPHKIISGFYCFMAAINGWVIFRIENLDLAGQFYYSLYSFNIPTEFIWPEKSLMTTLIIAIFLSFVPFFNWKFIDNLDQTKWPLVRNLSYVAGSVILLYLSVSFLTSNGFSPFIYYRF